MKNVNQESADVLARAAERLAVETDAQTAPRRVAEYERLLMADLDRIEAELQAKGIDVDAEIEAARAIFQ